MSVTASCWSFSIKKGSVQAFALGVDAQNYDGTISISVDKRQIRLGTSAADRSGSPNHNIHCLLTMINK